MKVYIDTDKRSAILIQETAETKISYEVDFNSFYVREYSKVFEREMMADRVGYTFDRSAFYVNPILTWVIKGIHGIPLSGGTIPLTSTT